MAASARVHCPRLDVVYCLVDKVSTKQLSYITFPM
jgi:hypothetical protein